METPTIHIKNKKIIEIIAKMVSDKIHVSQKIREGKIHEINEDIKFVKPL